MNYQRFSFEKLFSFPYDLKGFLHGFRIYCAEEKSDKNFFTILNISREKPEDSLGFLILYLDDKEQKYKATAKIPSGVKESPLENESFLISLIQNFYNQKISNFYFIEKLRKFSRTKNIIELFKNFSNSLKH